MAERFKEPAPRGPADPAAVYDEFRETIFPYPMGNIHPRFWGWYMGSGTVFGALAGFMAAIMNPNLGGGNHVANMVEEQVINWLKAMFAFPDDASGLLVSGGSMANLIGLAVRGIAAPSYTTLDGRYCLRVAIANYRSATADFDLLVESVVLLGSTLQNGF